MPRPKRARVAPSQPTLRVVKPTTSHGEISSPLQPLSELAATTSDDSEGLVTKNPTGLNRRGVARQEATMSGALAAEDVATAARLKPPRTRKRAAFSRIARDGDHDRAINALEARRDAALAKEKAAKEGGKLGSEDGEMAYQQRASGTALPGVEISPAVQTEEARPPLRRESSVLADFKRRPRKPSLLQMVQAQHQQPAAEDSDDDDSLNDFQPEDESTPFMKPRFHPTNAHSTPSASAPSVLQTSSSRKRKFGSPEPEVQVPASQSSPSQPSSSPPPRPQAAEADPFDIPADEDAREPSLPLIHSTQLSSPHAPSDPAPPTISSPQLSRSRPPPKSTPPPPTSLPKPRHLNKPPRDFSPPPSPLSTTSSHPSPRRSPQKLPPKPLTTASLQNLLPRRRLRPKDKEVSEFDLPSSSDVELSEDQDELSYHKAPNAKARKGAATPRGKAGKGGAKVGGAKVGGGKVGSTYARKKAMELPEDEGSEEEAGQVGEGGEGEGMKRKGGEVYGKSATAVKGEMRRLAQKFREVDDWALEIEDVTPHSGSSQMVDAR